MKLTLNTHMEMGWVKSRGTNKEQPGVAKSHWAGSLPRHSVGVVSHTPTHQGPLGLGWGEAYSKALRSASCHKLATLQLSGTQQPRLTS
jgi:hypothetical protein